MKMANGLLITVWLLFMGYKAVTITPDPYDFEAQSLRALTMILLFVQLIGWAFSFSKPFVTFCFMLASTVVSILYVLGGESQYLLMAFITIIFAILSLAAHSEVKKNKLNAKKQTKQSA
ncbi:hypothetical protein DCC85_13925 [Paenibacillus sp. CAA11]|uniref:hypothetical protein n=1 Tax=Paenibacillus sp. CAA11 TaxID=1532905 RepID=UPI000D390FEE|nr:hypothetical protein [Paenibacillus sp. CAA11]AWB45219.1 hypothetical protein DCC85_13925 [Paenibacillus sp. CAA11]